MQFAPRDLHFPPFFDIYCFYFGGVILLDSLFLMLRNLLIFSSYVENKNSFPKPLSREKEAEYVLRAENGDKEATELLIRHNLRLVAHIAKKYCNYPDTDELISIGSIGLIKAIRTYKSGKGTALATYAAKCIENEILMTLRVNKKHKNNVSLNDPVGTDRDGNELTIIDMLSTDEEGVITDVENRMLIEKVSEIVKTSLDKREYEIIVMRYGLNDTPSLTQREVAEKFGISRSYISRIEKKALQKIKSAIEKTISTLLKLRFFGIEIIQKLPLSKEKQVFCRKLLFFNAKLVIYIVATVLAVAKNKVSVRGKLRADLMGFPVVNDNLDKS